MKDSPMHLPRRARDDRGFVLSMSVLVLIPLLLVAAFAVDVGGWYAQGSKTQRAADAAALAGVVWMPDFAKAETVAREVAARNGFPHDPGGTGVTVTVSSPGPRKLEVTIQSKGEVYLSRLVRDDPDIERDATAEYVLPVPLGSPEPRLGNDPTSSPVYNPNLWASISGPHTDKVNGDPYSTKCSTGSSGSSCPATNTEYRTSGFIYAIEVPAAALNFPTTIAIYDAGHYTRNNYANCSTADLTQGAGVSSGSGCSAVMTGGQGVKTQFELFDADTTPLDSNDNLVPSKSRAGRCTTGPGRQYIAPESAAATYKDKWFTLCTFTPTLAGQYFLQVKSSNIPSQADSGNGWNQFSLQVTSTATTKPKLYAINDLSLFNNLPNNALTNTNANFYLAEVETVHRNKTMQIDLFDPGDGASGNYFVNIRLPDGTTPACRYGVRGGTLTSISTCRIQTRSSSSGNQYNGQWLSIEVPIQASYSCSTTCWWQIRYEFLNMSSGTSPNDRTVWSARIVGDPVHLIE